MARLEIRWLSTATRPRHHLGRRPRRLRIRRPRRPTDKLGPRLRKRPGAPHRRRHLVTVGKGEQVLDQDNPETPESTETPSLDGAGRPRRRVAGRAAGPPVATALFQAPDTTLLPARPRDEDGD